MFRGYEQSDASALKVMWMAFTLIVSMFVVFLSISALFFLLKSHENPQDLPPSSLNIISEAKAPILEVKAAPLNEAQLIKEKKLLESYRWLDRTQGIVQIPIETAIEILVYEH